MKNILFKDVEDLKKVVKINASLPWDAISPYILEAQDIYLTRYLSEALIENLKSEEYIDLLPYVRRALGPLAVMLAAPEMGISIGDAGITVANDQSKRSPASDAKINAAIESLRYRGFQAIDRLLAYLEAQKDKYPDWASSCYCTIRTGSFINSARVFQDVGLVNIDYSILTFNLMFPTIRQMEERYVKELTGEQLYGELLSNQLPSPKQKILRDHIIRFLANKTAELYTSQASKEQRERSGRPEFKPVIRPLYHDLEQTGNFFGDQANYYVNKISLFIIENAEEFGVTATTSVPDWNSKAKKIVSFIS